MSRLRHPVLSPAGDIAWAIWFSTLICFRSFLHLFIPTWFNKSNSQKNKAASEPLLWHATSTKTFLSHFFSLQKTMPRPCLFEISAITFHGCSKRHHCLQNAVIKYYPINSEYYSRTIKLLQQLPLVLLTKNKGGEKRNRESSCMLER